MGTGMTRLNVNSNAERWSRVVLAMAGMTAMAVAAWQPVAAQVPQGPATAAQPAPAKAKTKAKAAAPAQQEEAAEAGEGGAKTPQKPKKRDPAEAQRSIDSGVKLLQAGKADQAIGTFSAVISGGNLPPPVMAKALYNRGLAYRKSNKPAQAISDLTSALWLKGGLVEAERADALQARSAAYREAGLPDQSGSADTVATGSPATRAARNEVPPARAASALTTATTSATTPSPVSASTQTASLAPTPSAAAPSGASSGGGNFFSTLFGGGSSAAPATPPQAVQPPPAPKTDVGQAWSSTTRIQSQRAASQGPSSQGGAAPQQVAAAPPAATPQATAAATAAGRYKAQVALVRSADEAQAVVAKLKSQFAAALAQREPAVDQTTLGNMGAFFRVRVGPYASQAEAQGVCAGLKGSGLDCVPVSQ